MVMLMTQADAPIYHDPILSKRDLHPTENMSD